MSWLGGTSLSIGPVHPVTVDMVQEAAAMDGLSVMPVVAPTTSASLKLKAPSQLGPIGIVYVSDIIIIGIPFANMHGTVFQYLQ